MGAFLAVALKWRTQARNAIKGREALCKLREEIGAQKEEKQNWGLKEEASQSSIKLAHEGTEGAEAYGGSFPIFYKALDSKRRLLPPKYSGKNSKNWTLLGGRS